MAKIFTDENGQGWIALENWDDQQNVRWLINHSDDADAIANYNKNVYENGGMVIWDDIQPINDDGDD